MSAGTTFSIFPWLQKLRPSRICIGTAGKQVRSWILVKHLFFYSALFNFHLILSHLP